MNVRGAYLGTTAALLVAAAITLPIAAQPPAPPAVTVEDVQRMQARIPDCEDPRRCSTVGGFRYAGDALLIAQAIAHVAPTRADAADLTLYAAWESGNRNYAMGDPGPDGRFRAFGAWQLHAELRIATTPESAAYVWLAIAAASRKICASNPVEEQLAALASGDCAHGRAKVRHRHEVARAIEVTP